MITPTVEPSPSPAAITTAASSDGPPPGVESLALSSIAYRIPLTIRHVTREAAVLFFELDEPSPGAVYLVPQDSDAPPRMADLPTTHTRHLVSFDGLLPGTVYDVTVALGSDSDHLTQPAFRGRAWGPVTLHTFSGEPPVRFAAISDASFGDATTRALIAEMAENAIDFVLHAGDVVDETEEGVDPYDSYAAKYYEVFEPVLRFAPVYTVPGNHDYDPDIRFEGEPFYYRAFPAFQGPGSAAQASPAWNQFYAFDAAGIRFLMLDSQVLFGAAGRQAETDWLKDRLAEEGYRGTIVVLHVAPFSSSGVHPSDSLPVRSSWVPLFEEARVSLVLSGHFHQYERLSVNGVTYIVTGGGSSTLYAPGEAVPQSQIFKRQSHFVLGEIDGDTLTLTAIGLDDQIIDHLILRLEE